ncbi:lytic transglycosylase domain-containing protein [Pseudoxanthomonas wuyuanensis]|uniref:Membrane-bound lytic murein transglycosylase D n=1 Tax=Pseudoxanthomonas wuyuanensis TaxID=1073196 RepID=A0A286CV69_9GAMM|nr:lytic transglycosylase domain-containing protein [Pseudoxanthomonas wuyuanensis]KAF1721363.1 lytic transglycosylase [Pseudoxanthomonas wuyuanensis]SOD50301.1 membrane-bound lytic murein transglycosylase D [Pseudoxanthomonas wuyuanensis]
MSRRCLPAWPLWLALLAGPAPAAEPPPPASPASTAPALPEVPPIPLDSLPLNWQTNGLEIYQRFRDGLAEPECDADASSGRWKKQFSHAPGRLVKPDDDLLPLFGYVVDALREAHLPTEYALIPFVESGYKPGARNPNGPAGLWQFIGVTARNHNIPIRGGYDGRLSPVDSTRAAVRYLKTLHGMFGGDWRLAVMAYNAGEYRILQSMRRAGMNAQNARPAELPGLAGITYAYVEKLHALACIFQQADDRDEWLQQLDRPVPRLAAHAWPKGTASLERWAAENGHDAALLRRLNPALADAFSRGDRPMRVLAPVTGRTSALEAAALAVQPTGNAPPVAAPPGAAGAPPAPAAGRPTADTAARLRAHTVRSGESAWLIARRYGITPRQLLLRNGLKADSVLRPGMVLKVDEDASRQAATGVP